MGKALALLALPLALLLTWLQVRPEPPLTVAGGGEVCRPSVAASKSAGWNGRDARLFSSGFVRWRVCGPGILSFGAAGSVANGAGATLSVSWQDRALLETEARERQSYRVAVPAAGWVLLSFPNDWYRPPQDRNLYLYDAQFKASSSNP